MIDFVKDLQETKVKKPLRNYNNSSKIGKNVDSWRNGGRWGPPSFAKQVAGNRS